MDFIHVKITLTACRAYIFLLLLILFTLSITACDRTSTHVPVQIMPLGNSITQGDMDHPTYRYHLWKMLKNDGYDVDYVGTLSANYNGDNPAQDFDLDHEGHWGWRADQILNGIAGQQKLSDLLQHNTPDIVLMHLGSNDIFQGESIDQIISELKDIIRILRLSNNDIVILIAQILPVANKPLNTRITLLNKAIEKLPASMDLSYQLIVVNQNNGFNPYNDTYDGIHPNKAGEKKMADKWYESLRPVIK
jgi:acyl-CoA thioesterase-1